MPGRLALIVIVAATTAACSGQVSSVDDKGIEPAVGFVWSDNMMGTVLRSSDPDAVGKKVTFVGLGSQAPKVVFESGITSPLQRLYEDESTVTLVLVASGSGSLDGFVIDKTTGKFARATAGSFIGVYASGSVGRIQ